MTCEDLTGKIFGKWKVLKRSKNKCGNIYWDCECECGFKKSVYGSHLRLGRSLSCRKCSEHKHKHKLCSRIWHRIKYNAKKRNIEYGLSECDKQFLYDLLYVKQQCKCALSGLPIAMANTAKDDLCGLTTASLDRIDSKKGYFKENIQWVHKDINYMKSNLSEDVFVKYCKLVCEYRK